MKRARRRSAGGFEPQSDVSFGDTEEYQPNSGSLYNGERSSTQDRQKVELRRLKNREAARRVRERKSNQLNTYKSQVDELKRENQKLLQIIAQLQSASLGCVGPAMGAASVQEGEGPAVTASHSCLSAGESGGGPSGVRSADALGSASLLVHAPEPAPAVAVAAAAAAGGPPLPHSQQQQQQQQQQQRRLLANTTSCPPGAGAGAAHDAGQSGSCIVSQPVNSSSTLQLLSGCHSAPHGPLQRCSSVQARVQLQLQRTCGCQDDEECDECEGVRVTLSNASNLPLVTTPGPRPKLLTLDDLNLAVLSRGTSHPTGSLMSAPQLPCRLSGSSLNMHRDDQHASAAAASAGHSVDGAELFVQHHHYVHRKQHKPSQTPVKESEVLNQGMELDLVGTLEPSRTHAAHIKMDSNSSSGNAVFGGPTATAAAPSGTAAATAAGTAAVSCNESCYVRKTSNARQQPAQQQQQVQGSMGGDAAAVVSGSTLSGPGSGSAIQQLQQQLQQQQMLLQAAALSGSFNALQAPSTSGAAGVPDFAAAADLYMSGSTQAVDPALSAGSLDKSAAAAVLLPAAAGALGSIGSQDGVGLAGSNSSMMRPGSYVKSGLSDPAAAAGMQAGSFAAAQQQPQAAAATHSQDPQQQQQLVGSRKSRKTGQKLMRSIAAAVNTLVRPGRRTNTPTAAAAGGQPSDLVTRSMSALPAGYTSGTAAAAAAAAPASFTAAGSGTSARFQQDPAAAGSSAAVAMAQQQAMLLNSSLFAAGCTTKQQQQSQALLGQLMTPFDGEPSSMACSGMSQPVSQPGAGSYSAASGMSNPLQTQALDDPDAIIMAAQQLLHGKHQQRVSVTGSGSRGGGSMPPPAAAAAAAGQLGGAQAGGSRTAATAMDTTPIWLGQGSPCLPQQQLQQQAQGQGVFGLEQLLQPLGAAVLPLDFQATYTDGCLLDDDIYLDDAMLDDVVMQLARQEGVLINGRPDPNVQSFF